MTKSPFCNNFGADQLCRAGWKYYKGYCYQLRQELKAFNDAIEACRSSGGFLTQILSNAENDFVVSLLNNVNQDIWIGYYKRDDKWVWVKTHKDLPYYTNWDRKSYISTSHGDCALIWSHWAGKTTWDNRDCSSKKWFVCQAGEPTAVWFKPCKCYVTVFTGCIETHTNQFLG